MKWYNQLITIDIMNILIEVLYLPNQSITLND